MTDKAFIITQTFNKNSGVWGFDLQVRLGISLVVLPVRADSNPDSSQPAGGWKPIIRDATAALVVIYGYEVDEVIFPDYTSLPVPA